ncbi:MAG: PAS domain-containing protein [Pirellulaceae bacterium]|nr:PAS domain-containing protein [Pirellulaceae bacterium]
MMNTQTTLAHRDSRAVLIMFGASLVVVGFTAWAADAGHQYLPEYVCWLATAVCLVGGGLLVRERLSRLLQWNQWLSSLSQCDPQAIDAFSLPQANENEPAARGWNRLIEIGRRWQTLNELEGSLSRMLAGAERRHGPPLLDALSEGVATTDQSGTITYANAALAAICGAESGDALLGRPFVEALTTDNDAAVELRTAKPLTAIQWEVATESGKRTLQARFRQGRKSDGAAIAHVWTIRDITQQRLADQMRDQFLTTATHEFRTPLANIRAYAESLDVSDDLDTETRKRFYNVIQCESVRLSQLVDDLLDISRMQAGALALESHETDLGRLVEEVAAKVQGQVAEKQQEFRCEIPPKLPPKVCVDKGKLVASLVNLLGNAVKYTPDGGCVTFRVDIAEHKVQFTVTDTGIGISPQELPHVFDRFYRSSDERVRELTGSGLGLALSQEVARLHGGEITVESRLNHGSTFCLTIPLETNSAT